MKVYTCPIDGIRLTKESLLERHLEKRHPDLLKGSSAAKFLFDLRNKKTSGSCIICKVPTTFNEKTKKYNRLCDKPVCREIYITDFQRRMKSKYGKTHLLDDPEIQKKMLAQRSISGQYTWSDGTKFVFTGSYEEEFLKYCDLFLELASKDIIAPCPFAVEYSVDGEKHLYIPDFYIPSIDLIIEIKATDNKHYRERDKAVEMAKDAQLKKSRRNYIKIANKNYDKFLEGLAEGIWSKN